MAQIGRFFAGHGLFTQLAFLFIVLALAWLVIRPFKRLHPYTGQILVLVFVLWVGLLFYFLTYSFRVARLGSMATTAATMPRFWFVVLIPVSVLAFIPMLKGEEQHDPKWGSVWRVAIVFGALIISFLLFPIIGYYLSSAMFLVAIMWVLGSRNKLEMAAMPVGWVIFSYFFFAQLLNVRLPIGALFAGLF